MKVLIGALVLLLLALQYRLWFGDGSVQEVWRLREEVRSARTELAQLISRNQALAAEVADLKSGLDAIEERARADLGMIEEGETFYQFVLERGARQNSPLEVPAQPDRDASNGTDGE
ncbi:MAG: cell division protein FtsB [Granulosicoccus sp.]